jgi:hypothetical protein
MRGGSRIAVIVPALDEEEAIGLVMAAIPAWVDQVVVVDNGSTDGTAEVAESHGAMVVREDRRGYGAACLKGMESLDRPDVVIFLDADFSEEPGEADLLVDPIIRGDADLVIGSRVLGSREPGAVPLQARLGNRLACILMRLFWNVRYTDLGPFRAIRYTSLKSLSMEDMDFGWTVEMQIKAALKGLRVMETPVRYRRRIGRSKISGTIRGALAAGAKILSTIFKAAIENRNES